MEVENCKYCSVTKTCLSCTLKAFKAFFEKNNVPSVFNNNLKEGKACWNCKVKFSVNLNDDICPNCKMCNEDESLYDEKEGN